ncbi:MAG: RNA 3'-terminal phosphate cyclase [bacterium]|nr:RNA 3'-terminal phosphate cyclase [bacterium]
MTKIRIDGRRGEGGGQILRSSLALAAATGTPFEITNIRGGRKRPGLLRQHLTAVRAAAAVCGARIEGDEIGSSGVKFEPGEVRAGEYEFSVGTAGSAMLVLQTVLPPLLRAAGPSELRLGGGTHNPSAPAFEFLARTFAPMVGRMGGELALELVRPGFYPAGGGEVNVRIVPAVDPRPLVLEERGPEGRHVVEIGAAHLPAGIADREWKAVQRVLHWSPDARVDVDFSESRGPGNVLTIVLAHEHVTEVVTGFGAKGVPAERVARRAAGVAKRYLAARAPVGMHLADQLLVPMALLAGGHFDALPPSLHTTTNVDVVRMFLGDVVESEDLGRGDVRFSVRGRV